MSPDPKQSLVYRVGAGLLGAGAGLVLWLLWYLVLTGAFALEPRAAIAWAAAVTVTFLWMHAVPMRWNRRLRTWSRLRWPPAGLGWTAALAPGLLLLLASLSVLLLALGLATPDQTPAPLAEFMERPWGALAFVAIATLAVPVMEEVGFRGWVQRPLERRIGAQAAIGVTAVLFAAVHLGSSLFPARVAGGLVLGHAVYATRSVWTGILLHASWNAGMFALGALLPDWDPTGAGWGTAAPALACALAGLLWCVWTVRRMEYRVAEERRRSATPAP